MWACVHNCVVLLCLEPQSIYWVDRKPFFSFYAITLLSLGTALLVWMWHCPQNKVVSYHALEDVAIFFISAMQSGISES